ncbi:MAG: SMP-30/gluconolactonase/LRE family protein, partial [Cytophagales bacterium]|nr:SMP-30/gluconolactonase/LRE family protein [Cytophagales bacterium]
MNKIQRWSLTWILLIGACAPSKDGVSPRGEQEKGAVDLVLEAKAKLGEGALWDSETQQLWWVDIEGRLLHIFDPATGNDRVIGLPSRVGTVVKTRQGAALVALESGIYHLNLATEELRLVINPLDTLPGFRFNDGKCDPEGRFWVGSMMMQQQQPMASLYCLHTNGVIKQVLTGVTISNGIVWNHAKTKNVVCRHS